MEYKSVFDIIGPIMVGPSSSHTAGALRIAKFARMLFNKQPERVEIILYNSFAKTYKGHGTAVALVGGILNFEPNDTRIPYAEKIAKELGIEVTFIIEEKINPDIHPNTASLKLFKDKSQLDITGISVGGGLMKITEINGLPYAMSNYSKLLIVIYKEVSSVVNIISDIFEKYDLSLCKMEVFPGTKQSRYRSILFATVSDDVPEHILDKLRDIKEIRQLAFIKD